MGNSRKLTALALLGLSTGCVHLQQSAPAPVPLEVQAAQAMPLPAKNRVHVAFVSGPVDFAGLHSLRTEVIDQGFIKTYAGQLGQKAGFIAAFEAARRREPDARFAIVGHASGSHLAGELARKLEAEGAAVDLLLFLDPVGPTPIHGGRVLCLTTKGVPMEGAENFKLDSGAVGAAKHPGTRTVLLRELVEIASRVRVIHKDTNAATVPNEWDFLTPRGSVLEVPSGKPLLEAAMTPAG